MAAGQGQQRSIGRRTSTNGKLGVTSIGRPQTSTHTNTQIHTDTSTCAHTYNYDRTTHGKGGLRAMHRHKLFGPVAQSNSTPGGYKPK